MFEHRSTAALAGFFREQTPGWRRGVKVVVTDGSRAYKSAIDTWIPNARHVLDRFHVVRWFTAGLTAVRRDIQRRPDGTLPAFDPDVFRARFALLREATNSPTPKQPTSAGSYRPSPATGRLGRPPRTLRPLPRRRLRRRPRRARRFGSLRHRATSRVQQSRRHRYRLGRRNPRLASVRTTIQRPTRRSQQPPPSPPPSRTQRTPPTTNRQQHPSIPRKREGPTKYWALSSGTVSARVGSVCSRRPDAAATPGRRPTRRMRSRRRDRRRSDMWTSLLLWLPKGRTWRTEHRRFPVRVRFPPILRSGGAAALESRLRPGSYDARRGVPVAGRRLNVRLWVSRRSVLRALGGCRRLHLRSRALLGR